MDMEYCKTGCEILCTENTTARYTNQYIMWDNPSTQRVAMSEGRWFDIRLGRLRYLWKNPHPSRL